MAYNSKNYNKKAAEIVKVYRNLKTPDIPDTEIVRRYFPKYYIFLSYRQWMNIKGRVIPSNHSSEQLQLF